MRFFSTKFIGVTFFVLTLYLTIDFVQSRKENFWQFNYDFNAIKTHQNLGEVKIDTLSVDYLVLSTQENISEISNNSLLLTNNKETYYFSFENSYIENNQIKFTGGFWVLGEPETAITKFRGKIIDLPLISSGDIKINILTDSQLLWHGGRSFRKWLKQKNEDLYFVGANRDLYGYHYSGGILANTQYILNNFNKIDVADVYVICLGTHEKQSQLERTFLNFKELIEKLQHKSPKAKIYLINLPPSTHKERNDNHKKLNKALLKLVSDKVYLIDFNKLMLENNFENLIDSDEIHYQSKAYKLLIDNLNKKLHEFY